jgi:hypothetical protein
VIVIGNKAPEFRGILPELRSDQIAIDLVRIVDETPVSGEHYQGICW